MVKEGGWRVQWGRRMGGECRVGGGYSGEGGWVEGTVVMEGGWRVQ